jgi:hypothetical protein
MATTHTLTQVRNINEEGALEEFIERAIAGEAVSIEVGKTIVSVDFEGADAPDLDPVIYEFCDECGDIHSELEGCENS